MRYRITPSSSLCAVLPCIIRNQRSNKMKLHLKITSTILCLSLLFLSSCAETPESVKKGSKNENTATQGYALTSLDEMSKKKSEYIDELKKLECDNMNFSDILDIDIPQKIKTGDFICPTGFEDNYKEIFTHYDEDFNEANITNDDTTYPTGPSYEDKEKGLQLSIGCTRQFTVDFIFFKVGVRDKIIDLVSADICESAGHDHIFVNAIIACIFQNIYVRYGLSIICHIKIAVRTFIQAYSRY